MISRAKDALVSRLLLLLEEERSAVETDLARKLEELDAMRARHRAEEKRVEEEAAAMAGKLDGLAPPKELMNR